MGPRPVAASIRARVMAAAAFAIAACGGGSGGEAPFVPQPSPDCSPPVTPSIVASTSVAGPASDPGVCRQPVGQSTLPSSRVQHLGSMAVNTTARFDVPAGTGSFTIVEQAVRASSSDVTFAGNAPLHNTPVPMKIIDPSGAVFYDDMAPVPADFTGANAIYPAGRQGTGAFTAPNTSHALSAWTRGVPAGSWSFIVGDYAGECANLGSAGCSSGADATGVYDVTVLLRPGPVPTTGTIDFDVYLVTTRFQASMAATDSGLTRMATTLGSVLAEAGICVGRVTFIDVPEWAKTKYATGIDSAKTGPCDDLAQLFTLSLADDAIPIFLVDDIQQDGATGLRTVGIDGAIPGPSTIGGTILSGAVVNASDIGHGTCGSAIDFACGSDSTAAVTAHEAGHWLGLLHTTEKTGTLFDTLSDTGTCACSQCVPPDSRASCGTAGPSAALVTSSDCSSGSCSGADNLMFWVVGGRALSAQQGQLMRANPAVH